MDKTSRYAEEESCSPLDPWRAYVCFSRKELSNLLTEGCLGFTLGDTNTPFYQGQYVVDTQDIVVVTIKWVQSGNHHVGHN